MLIAGRSGDSVAACGTLPKRNKSFITNVTGTTKSPRAATHRAYRDLFTSRRAGNIVR